MRFVRLVLILGCGALLVNPPEGESCGPWLPVAQFGYVHNPGPEFAKGELGILQPGYYRRNLVVAFRNLSGAPLTAEEARAFVLPPWEPVESQTQAPRPSAMEVWLKARNAVPGAQPMKWIDMDRATLKNGVYSAYRNCLDDAFTTAAETLTARMKRWGPASPQVAEWLRSQDQVFANCGGDRMDFSSPPPHVVRAALQTPAPLPANADPLLAADRQYQVAAAMFYGGRFTEAAEAFRAVAANRDSPWRDSGRYLATRALIRQGTVSGNRDLLAAAEKTVQELLADPSQQRWHASARGLRDFLRGLLRPEERMVELSQTLSKPASGAGFQQALTDYTMLWDRMQKGPAARSDLADWITAFQAGDAAHAIERWRAGGSAAWLVAALTAVNPTDAAAPELADAARRIGPASPAYASAAYHGIRIRTARRERDDARAWADDALAANVGTAAHNAFLAERMALARDWAEFLACAPRRPVAADSVMPDEKIEGQWRELSPAPTFDSDAAFAINRRIPLPLWIDAAGGAALTPHLRGEIAQAGWVRAVILDRRDEARRLAALVAASRPELAGAMRSYQAEQDPDAARFAAVLAMLRNPGLAPTVRTGFGRLTKVNRLDDLRDNWWALKESEAGRWFWAGRSTTRGEIPAPEFLSDAQMAESDQQYATLEANAALAPDYLCAQTLAWARAHRDDPRVPEALHLAVRSTRYGITDAGSSAWSRRAFQLLHARYPKSEWAAKTKYWY